MGVPDPYHPGEIEVQELSGERERAARTGVIVTDKIPERALGFVTRQPMIVLGSIAPGGELWASLLFGEPGFAHATESEVSVDLARSLQHRQDPLWSNVRMGAPIGMLFIELGSRRRFRVNGVVSKLDRTRLVLEVKEAYPNCTKYIQRRNLQVPPTNRQPGDGLPREGGAISPVIKGMLETSDTFFVASAHPQRGLDASHRGGPPGFVQILDEHTLRIPDYSGNSMFNTLGNLARNPKAGLVFVDFNRGDVLQLTGRAEIHFGLEDPDGHTGGTSRFWDFAIDRWHLSAGIAPSQWEFLDYSPALPKPGR